MFPGNQTVGKPPAFITCHICGQKFGKQSMKFHVPQCEKKFEAQQALLPKNLRKPLPKPIISDFSPEGFANISRDEIEKYNSVTEDHYNNKVLVKCSKCGRTFFPESLMKHEPVCSAKPVKKSDSSLSSTQPNSMSSSISSNLSPSSSLSSTSKTRSPRAFTLDDEDKSPTTTYSSSKPDNSPSLKKTSNLTSKKKPSSPIQVQISGTVPVQVKIHGSPEDPQGYLTVSIIKELGCQLEGEGPDDEGRYVLNGSYAENEESEDAEIIFESPSWPKNNFKIVFTISSKFERLPLEDVEKDVSDSILTLIFPVSQKSVSTRKKIQL